jgi:hypothetical protein
MTDTAYLIYPSVTSRLHVDDVAERFKTPRQMSKKLLGEGMIQSPLSVLHPTDHEPVDSMPRRPTAEEAAAYVGSMQWLLGSRAVGWVCV